MILGLENRDKTNDQVTFDSRLTPLKKYGVAVKCATITPNAARVEEYHLKEMWKSPNGTIRAILDGTVFRTPIIVKGITPFIPTWKKPITIARHAYGDVYKNTEMQVACRLQRRSWWSPIRTAAETRQLIHEFKTPGHHPGPAQHRCEHRQLCPGLLQFCSGQKQDLWFATKDTISKKYDHRFKDIFQEIYDAEYKEKFEAAGIEYFYTLIDDAVARVVRSEGGYIWACKNYDGDVMSRHGGNRLWQPGHDDLRTGFSRRSL